MKLSVSEVISLRWASECKSPQYIAILEGWPDEAAAAHVASALSKLCVPTLREAIENAKIRGLI